MPYKRNKDLTDCAARFRLKIDGYYYLHVYLWSDRQSMYAMAGVEPPYSGCYVEIPRLLCVKTLIPKKARPKFGEIHMALDDICAGLWAHELMHFMLDWIVLFKLDLLKNDELLCGMTGKMTRDFWNGFYDTFKMKEGK